MTKWQRARQIFVGLCAILGSIILIIVPREGYAVVALILSFSLVFGGIRQIVYYCTMARHMIGGKSILYHGLIRLDIGMFALTLVDLPKLFIGGYLLVGHGFAGLVDIMKALESRRVQSPSWWRSIAFGLGNLALAVCSGVFMFSAAGQMVLVEIYSFGLLYSGITRIIAAFRKTAIVYVQ